MFPSLGYVDELTQAAEQGGSKVRSKMSVDRSAVKRVAAEVILNTESVDVHNRSKAGDSGVTYVFTLRERGSTYVVKFAPDDTHHLVEGANVYNHLGDVVGIPVPEVYAVETEPNELPSPYTLSSNILMAMN